MRSLTARIAAAFVSYNEIPIDQIAHLIGTIEAALARVTSPLNEAADLMKPAVPIKKSVRHDAITCLECGARQQMLKRHLRTAHNVTVDNYKAKWGLATDYPMVAPDYAAIRSRLAKEAGLGRKPSASKINPEIILTKDVGHRYPSSRWSKPA